MAYQKLSYSGIECKSYIYFAFHAETFNADVITNLLKITPTSIKTKKNPVPISSSWQHKIDAGKDIDLETHLEKLVAVFENKVEEINYLKNELKLETSLHFVIDIDINPNASTPYFGLSKKAIDFLYQTNTTVDFDIYKSDTIGLLENLK